MSIAIADSAIAQAKDFMLGNPTMALQKAKLAEQNIDRLPNSTSKRVKLATALWLQGEAIVRLRQSSDARTVVERALRLMTDVQGATDLKGDLLLSRGGIESDAGDVSAALADYQAAYRVYRLGSNTRGQAKALMLIASLYNYSYDHSSALKYLKQASELHNIDAGIAYALHNSIGNNLTEIHDYSGAVRQYESALSLAQQSRSVLLKATILANIARAKLLAGDHAEADAVIRQGLTLSATGEAHSMRAPLLALAAQSALQSGRMQDARASIDQGFSGMAPGDTSPELRDAHSTAYKIYSKLGDDHLALVHLEALKSIDDDATKLATSTNTALMAARFDFANQELRIAKLKADDLQRRVAYEREQAELQRLIFYGAAGATVVVIALLGFSLVTVRRSRNEVRAANIDLAATNTALAKALAAKTEFLATTSHEIRTPLNGILGMTQVMLADRALTAETRDRIGIVHDAGVTMKALVDDILDVAKIETGNMTVERAPVDMCAMLTEVSRLWREQAVAKGLSFTLDLGDCPARVEGDPARLRQIVFNLLANATKFTEQGGITVRASSIDQDGKARLHVTVSDTGIGIARDKLDLIFESFRQADAGTTRRFGGTGLGLAICRNLARAMDGDVSVVSVEGEGSVFTLDLPIVEASAAPDVSAETATALLLVDRNPIQRGRMRALLEPHAGRVDFAADIDTAVVALDAGDCHAVLIDDLTAKVEADPIGAVRRVAEAARQSGAVSAILWPGDDAAGLAALSATGVDQVIAKPVSVSGLIATLYPPNTTNGGKPPIPALVSQAA